MKYKIIVGVTIICIISLFVISCSTSNDVSIVQKDGKSYFSDFHIDGSIVHVFCKVTLRNDSDKSVEVELNALMPNEVKNGLLTQPVLQGINTNDDTTVFKIPSNTEVAFDVDFIGEHGNNDTKLDRMLPQIKIILLE